MARWAGLILRSRAASTSEYRANASISRRFSAFSSQHMITSRHSRILGLARSPSASGSSSSLHVSISYSVPEKETGRSRHMLNARRLRRCITCGVSNARSPTYPLSWIIRSSRWPPAARRSSSRPSSRSHTLYWSGFSVASSRMGSSLTRSHIRQ